MMSLPEDSFRSQGLRKKLVEFLRDVRKIRDERVLNAVMELPRHFFIPDSAFLQHAYDDKAFPIKAGQTISQPFTVAFQTELLQLQKGMKLLEIGTGSGYQTAILDKLGVKVFSIERQRELYDESRVLLPKLGVKARLFFGDGYQGLPTFAPFDRILVTCGAPFIPQPLVDQLKPGGRMVIPVGSGTQEMVLLEKNPDGDVNATKHGSFMFVPMLEDKART
jgi:protein-L-isoaspartate(D-aspartate) O-methyltransferase